MTQRDAKSDGLDHDPASHPAGGIGAVTSSLRHLAKEETLIRGGRALLAMNQVTGFDCPGCAWPEGKERSHAEFCENGAKALAHEATTLKADASVFARLTVPELMRLDDHDLEGLGRLTEPLFRAAGSDKFRPITWDDAFKLTADALRSLPNPDRAVFYTSGRTSNEAAFLWQLLARRLGTNNLPDCANLCHESSGIALTMTVGAGKGSVQLEDFEHTDAIFVIGQNPGTNHPRMLTSIMNARRRGAEVVVINPLRERGLESFVHPQETLNSLLDRGTEMSTVYLRPLPGSDVAVLKGIMKWVLEADRSQGGGVLDHFFIQTMTSGIEALIADLDATSFDEIEEASSVTRSELKLAADVYVRSRATIICWAMGLTQHRNAIDNVIACSNLAMLKGNIGKPGSGLLPVRGHSNVQGDRTVGITNRPRTVLLDGLKRVFKFSPPREVGLDTLEAIAAMENDKVDVFLAMGGNLAQAAPDQLRTHAALRRPRLGVHIATKPNRTHLVGGQSTLLLPCLARSERDINVLGEQFVTVEDSMSFVHMSKGVLSPASPELLSEVTIAARLGAATFPSDPNIPWMTLACDYAVLRNTIEATLPYLDHYDQRTKAGGFYIQNSASKREWKTVLGRAEFHATPTPKIVLRPGELRLMTIRSHDQYNTTVYGRNDRYRGIHGRRNVLFMNGTDMDDRHLMPGDEVIVTSTDERDMVRTQTGLQVVRYDIPRGACASYFPESNVLIPLESASAVSNQPVSKMVPVLVTRTTSSKPMTHTA